MGGRPGQRCRIRSYSVVQDGSLVVSCLTIWFAEQDTDDPKTAIQDATTTLITDAIEQSRLP